MFEMVNEPTLNEQEFNGCRVVNNLNEFKNISSIIIANRFNSELSDVSNKVYTATYLCVTSVTRV